MDFVRNRPIFTQFVNFCWSLFKWSLLVAVAGAIFGGGYIYLRLDDEIRRHVERRIAEHYSGMDVRVGRARFDQNRGIAIYDVAIADRRPEADSQPMLSIGEMYLAGKVRMEELVTSDLAISEVVVRRAALRAVRMPDGNWNVSTLVPLPQFGGQPPSVRVEDATLIVRNATHPTEARSFRISTFNSHLWRIQRWRRPRPDTFTSKVPPRECLRESCGLRASSARTTAW